MKIEIPGELPTLNQIIKAAKSHYHAYNNMKRENTEKVAWCAKKLPKLEQVALHITWCRKDRRTDPDNVIVAVKFILDGLVQAGVLENDGWKEVAGISHEWEIDKDNPRVLVKIEEVEGGVA